MRCQKLIVNISSIPDRSVWEWSVQDRSVQNRSVQDRRVQNEVFKEKERLRQNVVNIGMTIFVLIFRLVRKYGFLYFGNKCDKINVLKKFLEDIVYSSIVRMLWLVKSTFG